MRKPEDKDLAFTRNPTLPHGGVPPVKECGCLEGKGQAPPEAPAWLSPLAFQEKVTAQEIFGDAWQHWVVDEAPQCRGSLGCLYRVNHEGHEDPSGGPFINACAVGRLVTDEEAYGMYGTVTDLQQKWKLPERLRGHVPLLRALQGMHDGGESSITYRRQRMLEIAAMCGLEVPADA